MIGIPASAPVSNETLHRKVVGGRAQRASDTKTPATLFNLGTLLADEACHLAVISLHYTRRNGTRAFTHRVSTACSG